MVRSAQSTPLVQDRSPDWDRVVWADPDRLGGDPCFLGTRVPIRHLFDHLAAGDGIERFLEGYEGVTREQCVAVIQLAAEASLQELRSL